MNEMLYDMLERFNTEVKQYIDENMTVCTAESMGLDKRAGYHLYVSEDGIAVHERSRRSLEYYGGFEYVDRECVQTMGNYTFYLVDDDQVYDCVHEYMNKETA